MFVKRSSHVPPTTSSHTPAGVTLRELITDKDGAPNFAMRIFDLNAGASTPFHAHPWEHEVFVVKGSGAVRPKDGQEIPFRAGDCVYVAPEEMHCFVADRSGPLQFICVIPSPKTCG
jgi:quercetin dioxygenase-like cupin family protein